jgi:hypothetical protein
MVRWAGLCAALLQKPVLKGIVRNQHEKQKTYCPVGQQKKIDKL